VELERAVYQHLIADAAVAAIAGTRVYPDDAPPEAELPYAVHGEAEQLQLRSLAGVVDLTLYRMRVDCYARTRGGAKALRNAIRDALVPLRGATAAGGTLRVKSVTVESADADSEPPAGGEEMPARRAGLDLLIGYSAGA
jgi:hypothetical protein